MRNRRCAIVLGVAGALALTACAGSGSGGDTTVITYNTPENWANWGAVLDAFEQSSGITAPNDPKNSGQALAALEAEASAPAADAAYMGLVFGLEADNRDLFAEYDSDLLEEIPAELRSENGTWFTVHQGAIAFLVNTDAIGDVPVPECWSDLTDPQYAGLVGFLDPTAAAVGYSVLTAANLALGGSTDDWDPGMEWAQQLQENGLALPAQTATSAVQQGEIPILIDADFNGYELANNQGAPIEVVLPCEGTISVPYVIGSVQDSPNPDAAQQFMDFVLSDEAQALFAESYLQPVRDVPIPDEVAAAMASPETYAELVTTPDFEALNEGMDEVLARWSEEMR